MRPATLIRLALAGSRTDRLRVVFTTLSSALAAMILLAAATVVAVPELGASDDGSDGWNNYGSDLMAQPGLRPGVVATLMLVAVPILVLAGQSIRFGSPARDRRLSAVRLAGATPRQAVLIAAAETGLSALLGSLLGLGGYLLLRWALDRPDPDGRLPLPTDVLPSAVAIVVILLVVPVLAGLAGAFLLRKVIITPLGVVRQIREHQPSAAPGVLIITGIFAPFVIKPLGMWFVRHTDDIAPDLILVGIGLIILAAIVGVILGTGWITYTAGRLLQRFGRRPGMLLAGRQLMADPWSGSRTFAALLAAIIVGAGVYGYRATLATQFLADGRVSEVLGRGGARDDTAFYFDTIGLLSLAVELAMVVAAGGILVALAEGIVTRRRTYAALVATGVPRRTLGEAIAWQTFAPLIPAALVSLLVGIGMARAVGGTVTSTSSICEGAQCSDPASPAWHTAEVTLNVPIPYADLATLGAVTLAVAVGVVGVGLAFLRMSTDVEELRAS
ncbi:FtsX-like permease family protein [Micromonosporaceae bacterium Da 78-11]